MFARAADATGKVIASSDATKPRDSWAEDWDKPYQPPTGTGSLGPGDGETVWETEVPYPMYVIGVPIRQEGAAEEAAPAGTSTAFAGSGPQGRYLGAVYLGMSKEIIRRALALAVAKLVLVALVMLVAGIGGGVLMATMLVKPIHALRDGVVAVGKGVFDHRVNVKRRDELGALARSFNEMTQGLGERELIRNAFGAYVSSDVLNDILANPDAMKVGGARRTVTRMFTDVRGFTAMSEKLDPAEVVKIINAYLDVQAKAVARHKGYLDRFIGDAVSAVFGVPAEGADDAQRAVKCAWVIKQEIAKMCEERAKQGLLSPKVGIGLDTGPAIAGNLGAQGIKLDYSVIGEPVSGSESIQDSARDPNAVGAQAIMSENTWQLVKDMAETRELAPLTVKGRSKPIRVFELVGMKGA
jgi:adenylate cyclase